ncbi:RDD family protein [Chitinophaga oryzae]|uniref:RDD family protein n=1 Tax=Chitinophaga oryzae TaxID=2725414 RepID=A0AAE6ZK02_9BACT|nr:RDD family protein [Chitinophaga oryzae]QJB33563.1 RDD family protein [Chitinophaga oryzae]QJB40085.1 RDD family protein [Chitinophaga oryzae]
MSNIKIPTSFNIDLEFETAEAMTRFLAWLIDFAIRGVYVLAAMMVISSLAINSDARTVLIILAMLPVMLYFLVMESIMGGYSPGKKILHIKAVSLTGNQPTVSQHMIRWIFRMIESPLMAGLFFIPVILPIVTMARTPYNQRLGDLVAGTIVINTKRKGSIEETIFRDMSASDYQPQFPQIMRLSDRDMNKVKDLLDKALKAGDEVLAAKVAFRVKEVLHIESELPNTNFLETVLNDYNYYTTRDN